MIRDGHTGDGALIGNNGVQYLQQIRNAVRGDMSKWAENSGAQDVADAARQADEYYQQQRVPFKKLDVARAATATDADRIFDGFIQAGSPEKAQRYYDALEDRGRAAVRSQMAMDAVNQATDQVRGTVDANKLFNYLAKMHEPYGVFFRGTDKFELDGLRNFAQQELLNQEQALTPPDTGAPAIRAQVAAQKAIARTARARVADASATADQAAEAAKAAQDVVKATNERMNKYPLGAVAGAGITAGAELARMGWPHAAVVSATVGGVAGLVKLLTSTQFGPAPAFSWFQPAARLARDGEPRRAIRAAYRARRAGRAGQ